MSMNQGVVILPSFWEAIKDLKASDRLALLDAVCRYGLEGEEVELTGMRRSLFMLMKPLLDSSARRYQTAVANGKKGGRPSKEKETDENPDSKTKNQREETSEPSENQDIDYDLDYDKEIDMDSERGYTAQAPSSPPMPEGTAHTGQKQKKRARGEFCWVKLSDSEVEKLIDDLGPEEYQRCLRYVDEAAQATGNKNRWRDWNLVLRKCSRDGWGRSTATGEVPFVPEVSKYERYMGEDGLEYCRLKKTS